MRLLARSISILAGAGLAWWAASVCWQWHRAYGFVILAFAVVLSWVMLPFARRCFSRDMIGMVCIAGGMIGGVIGGALLPGKVWSIYNSKLTYFSIHSRSLLFLEAAVPGVAVGLACWLIAAGLTAPKQPSRALPVGGTMPVPDGERPERHPRYLLISLIVLATGALLGATAFVIEFAVCGTRPMDRWYCFRADTAIGMLIAVPIAVFQFIAWLTSLGRPD
jgi:hypothetical protein